MKLGESGELVRIVWDKLLFYLYICIWFFF